MCCAVMRLLAGDSMTAKAGEFVLWIVGAVLVAAAARVGWELGATLWSLL